MGEKTYDKRHREHKERESIKKRIRQLGDYLPKLPKSQLNRILGFDKDGRTIENKNTYQEARDFADFLSNYIGLGSELIRRNRYLYEENMDLKKIIKDLEKKIKEKTGIDHSPKLEHGLIYEPYPHRLHLTDQYICPKCKEAGLPIKWKERWVWCHFDDPLEHSWQKPKMRIHKIRRGGLGNWWKKKAYSETHDYCFLFGGRGSKIKNSLLISE